MPTYEYECSGCGANFDVFQSMKDDPLRDCPHCGGTGTLTRLVGTGGGIIFKGSGFYETDYKRTSASGDNGEAGGADKKSKNGTDATSPASGSKKPTSSSPEAASSD